MARLCPGGRPSEDSRPPGHGRMSEKTTDGFRYIGGFIRRVLGRFSLVTAQSAEYRERYTTLGCDPHGWWSRVTSNMISLPGE